MATSKPPVGWLSKMDKPSAVVRTDTSRASLMISSPAPGVRWFVDVPWLAVSVPQREQSSFETDAGGAHATDRQPTAVCRLHEWINVQRFFAPSTISGLPYQISTMRSHGTGTRSVW